MTPYVGFMLFMLVLHCLSLCPEPFALIDNPCRKSHHPEPIYVTNSSQARH